MNRTRIALLKLLSALAYLLSGLTQFWVIALVALLFLFDTTPHLRWDYAYQDYGVYQTYYRCTFLGAKGFITIVPDGDCPLVTLLSPHDERRIK
jgi:hypothetical protein